ncbi:hypothetical protein FOA52_014295 [Chlamydomonas sp. UWO 241]|nr:hypothetical protein FOA52_014295 [Chlamydomonas sp. UWO 241]
MASVRLALCCLVLLACMLPLGVARDAMTVTDGAGAAPTIDGRMDDPAWEAAPWSEAFSDINGPEKLVPRHATRMKMLWDDQYLYIGLWNDEPHPWANLTLHDSIIYKDNAVEVFIDPDSDNHNYYEVEVNALGTMWDLFLTKPYRDGAAVLHNWETLEPARPTMADGPIGSDGRPTGWRPMRHAVWVDGALNDGSGGNSKGWGVEMAIPWSVLGMASFRPSPPAPGDQWRVQFSRVQWIVRWDVRARVYVKAPPQQEATWYVWTPQHEDQMHKPEVWGYVQFSSAPAVANATVTAAAAATTNATTTGGSNNEVASTATEAETETTKAAETTETDATKAAAGAAGAVFVPDPSWPLRSFLMQGYYAQAKRKAASQPFAGSMEELGLEPPERVHAVRPLVQATEASFIVSAQMPAPVGTDTLRYYVNEEGRITWRAVTAAEGD